MKSFKEKVIYNFSKSAPNYDQYALLQKKMSEALFSLITKDYEKILDVGCGTGILVSKIAENHPRSKIIGLDIAPGMINYSASNIKYSNAGFIEGDGEALLFNKEEFDLVVSSAALQWMDCKKAVPEASRVLKPGGSFIFSTFGPATLCELKEAGLSVNTFPEKEVISMLLNQYFKKSKITSEIIMINYDTPLEAFKYLKDIGAHISVDRKHKGLLTKKKLISFFPQQEQSFSLSFEIYYGDCVK